MLFGCHPRDALLCVRHFFPSGFLYPCPPGLVFLAALLPFPPCGGRGWGMGGSPREKRQRRELKQEAVFLKLIARDEQRQRRNPREGSQHSSADSKRPPQ